MTKALRKAIMTRSRLKSIYLKNQNTTNWNNYKSQCNFCTNLLRKTKRDYFHNLNIRELNDNKKFWKRIKPFFSNKGLANNSIVLKENGNLITDTQELANLFNTYHINLINTLQLKNHPQNSNPYRKFFLSIKTTTVFLKLRREITCNNSFISKRYHLMK